MSRFFRSGDSSSSSSVDDDEVIAETARKPRPASTSEEANTELSEISTLSVSENNQVGTLNSASQQWSSQHKDTLLHALLEDWCLNETVKSLDGASRDSPEVQAEARARYLRLISQLAPLNVLPAGLEGDQHATTRQRYRDGLSVISRQGSATAVPTGLRRMLTDGRADGDQSLQSILPNHLSTQNAAAEHMTLQAPLRRLLGYNEHGISKGDLWSSTMPSPPPLGLMPQTMSSSTGPSRYHSDFEELRILGHGGYGIVYHARNRLDNQAYAVKKVPLSAARLHRVRARGQLEVDEILLELRMLARLNHPNVVRYYSAWVEWAEARSSGAVAFGEYDAGSQTSDAVAGAGDSRASSTRRVITEDEIDGNDIVFENSGAPTLPESESGQSAGSAEHSTGNSKLRRTGTRSTIATASDETIESIEREPEVSASIRSTADGAHFAQPTLAIHIQMSLHPMTLTDLLSSTHQANGGENGHINHCYHLGPSVGITTAVLEGLEYLQEEGVVHRDIKPANIFLSPTKTRGTRRNCVDLSWCGDCQDAREVNELEVCIGDFGLAAVADPETNSSNIPASPASPVGTAMYRPPAAVESMSTRLDIYALGIVLFELLWKFETRMERHHSISELKEGRYPQGFCEWVGRGRGVGTMECIDSMLTLHSEDQEQERRVDIGELKRRLAALVALDS